MASVSISANAFAAPESSFEALWQWLLRHRLSLFLLVFAAIPLAWPRIPPLVDVPAHLARYHVAFHYGDVPAFRNWFEIRHVLVGNLGVDLLVAALAPVTGVEAAAKLVIIAIPVLTAAGVLLTAREVHGKVGPLTALAATLVYNYPFNFGFINYSLSMAFALLAFGLWLRLARLQRTRLRAILYAPLSFLVWTTHASGWGLLGLMIFSWEAASAHAEGKGLLSSLRMAALHCLPLSVPILPMLLWSARVPLNPVYDPEHPLSQKFASLFMPLRDGVQVIDVLSSFALALLAIVPRMRRDLAVDRRLVAVGLVLIATAVVMPPHIIGSAYADMRIVPYGYMFLMLSLSPAMDTLFVRRLKHFALFFFTAQMVYHSVNYIRLESAYAHQLEALGQIPHGTTVFALVSATCGDGVSNSRMNHIHRMAIVKRNAFTNGSWAYPSTQTVLPRPWMTEGYEDDSSQLVAGSNCADERDHTIQGALAVLPRDRYRYLWLIDIAPDRWPVRPWLHRIWQNDSGALYRIDRPTAARG